MTDLENNQITQKPNEREDMVGQGEPVFMPI